MLRKPLTVGLCALGLLFTSALPSFGTNATGDWMRPNGASMIRIQSCGKTLCGKLVWTREPSNDTQNPDPSKRNRSLLGVQIVQSMKPTGKDNQWKGKVYNAEDGKTYTGFIELTSNNKLKLEGCVLGGLICKGETWTRVK